MSKTIKAVYGKAIICDNGVITVKVSLSGDKRAMNDSTGYELSQILLSGMARKMRLKASKINRMEGK